MNSFQPPPPPDPGPSIHCPLGTPHRGGRRWRAPRYPRLDEIEAELPFNPATSAEPGDDVGVLAHIEDWDGLDAVWNERA